MRAASAICLAVVLSVFIISVAAYNIYGTPELTDPLAQQLREAFSSTIQEKLIKMHEGGH